LAELKRVYLAKGARATTAIEGNTLTEEEVRARIDGRLRLPPSKEYLALEIDNIVAGCIEIQKESEAGQLRTIDVDTIKNLNRRVLESLPGLASDVRPGEISARNVIVGSR
jgi:hypothetical protein